ncbi:unnamed protein product [Musa acuminata var. zebrina]
MYLYLLTINMVAHRLNIESIAVTNLRPAKFFACYLLGSHAFVLGAGLPIPQPATMRPSHLLLILLSLFSSLLHFASAGPTNKIGEVAGICSHTDYPFLCIYASTTYGQSYLAIDAASLLAMHIKMTVDHTQTAKAIASTFAVNPTTTPQVKQALEVCLKQYDDAFDDLATGSTAVAGHDAGTANSMLSAVISYYGTCDDAFAEIYKANPLAKQDDFLMKMVSNALALAQLILQ